MSMSIEQARGGVQSAFEQATEWAEAEQQQSFATFEQELWSRMLVLGRALVVLFLIRAAQWPRPTMYEVEGKRYTLIDTRTSALGTLFGKVRFRRPIGRRVGAVRMACDLPVDRDLGLCSGFSLGVVTAVVRLCAQLAYTSATQAFGQFCEWMPSRRAVLRMIDAAGGVAREFVEQAPPPEDDGEVLVIQVDGKGAPTISSREHRRRARPHRPRNSKSGRHHRKARRREFPRKRRKPGEKSKNAKVAAVAVLYTLRESEDGLDGPVNKRVVATFVNYRALFVWLKAEAVKRGYGTDKFKRVLFLADGADVLWTLQQEFFPDAEMCLDWYHVAEKLWAAAKCLYRDQQEELETWVAKQKKRLRKGSFDAVITDLIAGLDETPRTGPGNKYRHQVLSKIINHFNKNRKRMRYHRLRRLDLDIATGAVEGAVRHVVGMRFDGPGMRWGLDRLELLLHLRCILVNGMWDEFVVYLASKQQLRLAAQPTPTRTHDAKSVDKVA